MTTPVLDLRAFASHQSDNVRTMVVDQSPGRLPVLTGTAHGFMVEAQGSGLSGYRNGILIRLTAPDGRAVNLVGPRHGPERDTAGLVADALSPAIRAVLTHRRLSAARAAAGAEAMARAIAAADRCLAERVSGTQALIRVASAAEKVDPALVAPFDATNVLASRFERGEVRVWQVARMIRCGLTVEDAASWFGPMIRCSSTREFDARMKVIEAFMAAGWTAAQVRTMEGFESGRAVEASVATGQPYTGFERADADAWAVMSWEDAVVALNAGLSGRAAARLWQSGEWDATALTALGALRRELVAS